MIARSRGWLAAAAALALALGACHAAPHDAAPAWRTGDATGTPADAPRASPGFEGIDGRRVVAARTVTEVAPFGVLAREPALEKAPCAGCHTVPLAQLTGAAGDARRAHWRVRLVHAGDAVMTCTTCHGPDDVGTLRTLTGRPVAVDHAYEVCAQCHAPQRIDWEGGAHGKRANGWLSPRAVYNCTECHDPHRPALETRWPARTTTAIREP